MQKRFGGFTLIELMIVVAIIGLLAALAIPNFVRFQGRARQTEARAVLKSLWSAEKAYYADKQAYCSALNVVGFAPERHNRYLYTVNTGAALPLDRSAATETVAGGVATDCGALTGIADATLYETIGSDQYIFKPPVVAYQASALAGVVFIADALGDPVPAAVGVTGAVAGCPAGACAFAASAQGNVDNDSTNDEWIIGSTGGTSTSAGNFVGGEPVNTINDVNS